MVRAVFLAIGICVMILGAECLGVQKIILKKREAPAAQKTLLEEGPTIGPNKTITPTDWAPWTLLGAGAIVCIYSYTIPIRLNG
jgi:hypothetical protein